MAAFALRAWARKGAEQRLAEMAAEAESIFRAFPELRSNTGRRAASAGTSVEISQAEVAVPQRHKRRMSAAARKAIGAAQKKRWAEWRKKNGGTK